MSNIIHPNQLELAELINSKEDLFIDFYASWCGPCQMLSPSIERLADEHPEVKVIKIDIDTYPAIASQFNVLSVPCLFVVKKGIITARQLGFTHYQDIEQMLAG